MRHQSHVMCDKDKEACDTTRHGFPVNSLHIANMPTVDWTADSNDALTLSLGGSLFTN